MIPNSLFHEELHLRVDLRRADLSFIYINTYSVVNFCKFPISEGIGPARPLFFQSILITVEPEEHVTPAIEQHELLPAIDGEV